MWICQRCGEPHQDQFKECWKCAGAQAEESVVAGEPPPRPAPSPTERKLRPLSSIIVRGLVGFLVGLLLSLSSLNFINPKAVLPDVSSTDKFVISLWAGAIVGSVVGLFIWVMFPYEPTA